jgi:hypothetical protein
MMTMNNHMQFLGGAFAGMLCAALAAAPGLAQDAATGGPGGDASRVEGGVGDDTATKSGAHINGADPAGDHGSANRSRAGDGSHIGVPAHDASGIEARAGAAPAGSPGLIRPGMDDLGPIRLEGFTGLQRRANRNALIANAPKTLARPPAAIGISAPLTFPGANGGMGRSTASVPGTSGSAFGPLSLGRNAPDLKTSAAIGANVVGPAAATGAGAAWRRPSLPSSAVTGAPSHAAVISGTTVSHIASGPGYLGGPAKDRSGINGTAIRPKY